MRINTYIPLPILQPFVRHYMVIEAGREVLNRVLPGTGLVLAFRYSGQVNYIKGSTIEQLPKAVLSGLQKSVRLINYSKDAANLLVVFKEGGATAFFKQPLSQLFAGTIPLDELIPAQQVSIIEEQLSVSPDNNLRIAIIDQFLLSILCNTRPDTLINAAVEKIRAAKGNVKIKELVTTLYISKDAFEKRFRKTIGTSPKQFAQLVRLQHIITQKQKQTLTGLAFDAGYFDQPHFNKEFKLFTGQTPTDFFKTSPLW
jgi:AraC-like DNA-binding protein